jgi:hypothetical protein
MDDGLRDAPERGSQEATPSVRSHAHGCAWFVAGRDNGIGRGPGEYQQGQCVTLEEADPDIEVLLETLDARCLPRRRHEHEPPPPTGPRAAPRGRARAPRARSRRGERSRSALSAVHGRASCSPGNGPSATRCWTSSSRTTPRTRLRSTTASAPPVRSPGTGGCPPDRLWRQQPARRARRARRRSACPRRARSLARRPCLRIRSGRQPGRPAARSSAGVRGALRPAVGFTVTTSSRIASPTECPDSRTCTMVADSSATPDDHGDRTPRPNVAATRVARSRSYRRSRSARNTRPPSSGNAGNRLNPTTIRLNQNSRATKAPSRRSTGSRGTCKDTATNPASNASPVLAAGPAMAIANCLPVPRAGSRASKRRRWATARFRGPRHRACDRQGSGRVRGPQPTRKSVRAMSSCSPHRDRPELSPPTPRARRA